jgi:hydrogenase maturation factor HypF (carbamoyltransferase family)
MPFAVMFRNIDSLREYCLLDQQESDELISWRRPIMILKQRKQLAPSVSNGLNKTGAMLPYMPVHYQLFRMLDTPVIVLTSGNISDEPVITDDDTAATELGRIADAIISYNRKIINRCDDSVVRIIDSRTRAYTQIERLCTASRSICNSIPEIFLHLVRTKEHLSALERGDRQFSAST